MNVFKLKIILLFACVIITFHNLYSKTYFITPIDTSIQHFINIASPGDTLIIGSGEYYECLYINKSLALEGALNDTSKIYGNDDTCPTISIEADNVILKNISIHAKSSNNSDAMGLIGIELKNSNMINVNSCYIYGGKLDDSYQGTINVAGNAFAILSSENIYLDNCKIIGGCGTDYEPYSVIQQAHGGPALKVDQTSNMQMNFCNLTGGKGSDGGQFGVSGFNGGCGIIINNSSRLNIHNSVIDGGEGGWADSETANLGAAGIAFKVGSTQDLNIEHSNINGRYIEIKTVENIVFKNLQTTGVQLFNTHGNNRIEYSTIEAKGNFHGIFSDSSSIGLFGSEIYGGLCSDKYHCQAPNGIHLLNYSVFRDSASNIYGGNAIAPFGDNGDSIYTDSTSYIINITLIEEKSYIPNEIELKQNFPNPFNQSTTIEFNIAKSSHVVLEIYNIKGSEVATLKNERMAAGRYRVSFKAKNLASGIYIFEIKTGYFRKSRKMLLIK